MGGLFQEQKDPETAYPADKPLCTILLVDEESSPVGPCSVQSLCLPRLHQEAQGCSGGVQWGWSPLEIQPRTGTALCPPGWVSPVLLAAPSPLQAPPAQLLQLQAARRRQGWLPGWPPSLPVVLLPGLDSSAMPTAWPSHSTLLRAFWGIALPGRTQEGFNAPLKANYLASMVMGQLCSFLLSSKECWDCFFPSSAFRGIY